MKILKITNVKTGKIEQSDFKTINELNAHLEIYKALGHWGQDAYVENIPEKTINHLEVAAVIENDIEISPLIPAYVEIIPAHSITHPADYSIEILDTDAEEEAEETAKAERKAEMQELKTFITNVNESQLPVWHKKLLKVLIRELKD